MTIKRETVEERKALPIASGVLDYFPDALLVVAEVSRVGNEQHHPGEPLHWDKSKSTDEADALLRHLLDRGKFDTDGLRHSGKVAWRALAMLQRELDAEADGDPDEDMNITFNDVVVCTDKACPIHHQEPTPVEEQLLTKWQRLLHTAPAVTYKGYDLSSGEDYTVDAYLSDDPIPLVTYDSRGEWPPDFRVDGRLTCCGQSEHPIDCPQYRA